MLSVSLIPKLETPITLHKGVYKRVATTGEAVFMITGMTIGAGILGLPYVVAQVGALVGLVYILLLGLIMLALHLMIGEVAMRTRENLQLPGLAGKYLGGWAKHVLSVTIVCSACGALLAYIVGEGSALAALFGGSPFAWSIIFWSLGSFLVWRGLQNIKKIEGIFSFLVITIIITLSAYLLPKVSVENLLYFNASNLFLPFGVILFALHAAPAVAEAHALIPNSEKRFRRALILGTGIPIVVYILFALAVAGVSGLSTTEVATVGLGAQFGRGVVILANIFAVLAMSTGFMTLGTALRETFEWDHQLPKLVAEFLVISVPLALFLLGARSFVKILEVVGGFFISFEAIMMVLVYWQARRRGDIAPHRPLRHPWLVALPVAVFFGIVMLVSLL